MSIYQVAKMAGVSSSTVSRVINNRPRVAPETMQRVKKAMRELSYAPSDRRTGLKQKNRSGKVQTVFACLACGASANAATPGFVSLLRGVSAACDEQGIDLEFAFVTDIDRIPARLAASNPDGLLLHGTVPCPTVQSQIEHLPTVWLMGNRQRPAWGDQVIPNPFGIGEAAADYLLGRGHHRVAFVNLDSDHWVLRSVGDSFRSYLMNQGRQIATLGAQARLKSTDYWQPYDPEVVDGVADAFMAMDPPPTGVFVADSLQLAVLLPKLQRLGLNVNHASCDFITGTREQPYLSSITPSPAAVDICPDSIGRHAVDLLKWRIGHPQDSERITRLLDPGVVAVE